MDIIDIKAESVKFELGLTDISQLKSWLEQNTAKTLVFCGRSNVGKSSCINALFVRKTARVSNTPGRTRQINIFSFQLTDRDESFVMIDLPGYGHASVSKEMGKNWSLLINELFAYMNPYYLVLNIQDARHPMQASDLFFKEYMDQYPCTKFLIFNKIDKLKKQKDRALFDKQKKEVLKSYKNIKEVYQISAESKQGIEQLKMGIINFLLLTF